MRKTRNIIAAAAAGMILLAGGNALALTAVGISDTVDGRRIAVPVILLPANYTVADLSGREGSRRYFRITVPAGQAYLTILAEGGYGDVDLYVGYRHIPSPTDHHFASAEDGNYEELTILNPEPGNWLILVQGHDAYAGVSLVGSFWQQDLYADTGPYVIGPTRQTNVCVSIDWGLGHGRPLGGLIGNLLRQITERPRFRHVAPLPRRGHGGVIAAPPVVFRPTPPVVVRPAPPVLTPRGHDRRDDGPGRGRDARTAPRPTAPAVNRPAPRTTTPPTVNAPRPTAPAANRPAPRTTTPPTATAPRRESPAATIARPEARPTAPSTRARNETTARRAPSTGRGSADRTTARPSATGRPEAASAREKLLEAVRDRLRNGRG